MANEIFKAENLIRNLKGEFSFDESEILKFSKLSSEIDILSIDVNSFITFNVKFTFRKEICSNFNEFSDIIFEVNEKNEFSKKPIENDQLDEFTKKVIDNKKYLKIEPYFDDNMNRNSK